MSQLHNIKGLKKAIRKMWNKRHRKKQQELLKDLQKAGKLLTRCAEQLEPFDKDLFKCLQEIGGALSEPPPPPQEPVKDKLNIYVNKK